MSKLPSIPTPSQRYLAERFESIGKSPKGTKEASADKVACSGADSEGLFSYQAAEERSNVERSNVERLNEKRLGKEQTNHEQRLAHIKARIETETDTGFVTVAGWLTIGISSVALLISLAFLSLSRREPVSNSLSARSSANGIMGDRAKTGSINTPH